MRKHCLLLLIFFIGISLRAQVPSFGQSTRFDVACWNVEWFGSTSNGPSNEIEQFNNVLEVFRNTNIDIWGLQEISSQTSFEQLLDSLPRHGGILAPISQTQKTAFLYDTGLFNLLYSKLILTGFSYDFASGRFPFEIGLSPKTNPQDTIIAIVIHLKANVGDASQKQISWQRRKNASEHMYSYLKDSYPNKKVILLGDFNDDTDISIHNNNPTPFSSFLNDSSNFRFLTIPLSMANQGSTVGRTDMVDHILVTNEWFSSYEPNSCKNLPLDTYFSSYGNSTSDHYPVFAAFNTNYSSVTNINLEGKLIYPNPMRANSNWKNTNGIKIVSIVNYNGKKLPLHYLELQKKEKGIYLVQYKYQGELFSQKVLIH